VSRFGVIVMSLSAVATRAASAAFVTAAPAAQVRHLCSAPNLNANCGLAAPLLTNSDYS